MRWCYALLVAVYVIQGHQYAQVWTSDLALWEHAAYFAPQKPRPAVNYAKELIQARRLDEAYHVTRYADYIRQAPHITESERRTYGDILERNLLLLSYMQEVAGRKVDLK